MDTFIPDTDLQKSVTCRKRAITTNKSCIACRARKVKCDAAVVGIPCSTCANKQSAENCRLPIRKGRTRKIKDVAAVRADEQEAQQSDRSSALSSLEYQGPRANHAEPDLSYLEILNDAVTDSAELRDSRSVPMMPGVQRSPAELQQRLPTRHIHLNDVDNDYLARKGVYNLPQSQQLDVLIKTYLDHVYPFVPVINRSDFVRQYESGHCSLFLLYAMLSAATLHASTDVLSACGFSSRSEAQESFFTKARLLHDFATEREPLLILQGSVALCMVVQDHPTDRDFSYWFHNAVRIATKLEICRTCIREGKPRKVVWLYRRIWWVLCSFDIFHVFANTKCTLLLEHTPEIKPSHEDDWEDDDLSSESSSLLTAVTPQQRASPMVHYELSQIFREYLSRTTNRPHQDPRQLLLSLDMWREALPTKLHVGGDTRTDVYYLNIQVTSYRYECILCRSIHRGLEGFNHGDWTQWTKQRLRSAILELDIIAMRVLATENLQCFPIYFVTSMMTLLAFHIEAALDSNESDLVRSISRISTSQIMLLLSQRKEIPALKRALPIFEEILTKRNLHWAVPEHDRVAMQIQPQQYTYEQAASTGNPRRASEGNLVPQANGIDALSASALGQQQQFVTDVSFDIDLLGFDLLDDWQIGQF